MRSCYKISKISLSKSMQKDKIHTQEIEVCKDLAELAKLICRP